MILFSVRVGRLELEKDSSRALGESVLAGRFPMPQRFVFVFVTHSFFCPLPAIGGHRPYCQNNHIHSNEFQLHVVGCRSSRCMYKKKMFPIFLALTSGSGNQQVEASIHRFTRLAAADPDASGKCLRFCCSLSFLLELEALVEAGDIYT